MVISKKGLVFIKIKQNKLHGNDVSFSFEIDFKERYFESETVKGAFEYDDEKLIVLVDTRKNFLFINRKLK
jgi:hypothetical protein